jgi:hypothetical protein
VALLSAVCLLAVAAQGSASTTALPNPCQLVPNGVIDSALGLKKPPAMLPSMTTNVSTCSYKGGLLTVAVGYTALTNPVPPATITTVPELANGNYETFRGTTQTEVTFFVGSASSGLYAVIRNFAKIPKKKLEKIAVALQKALGGTTGAPGTALIP